MIFIYDDCFEKINHSFTLPHNTHYHTHGDHINGAHVVGAAPYPHNNHTTGTKYERGTAGPAYLSLCLNSTRNHIFMLEALLKLTDCKKAIIDLGFYDDVCMMCHLTNTRHGTPELLSSSL